MSSFLERLMEFKQNVNLEERFKGKFVPSDIFTTEEKENLNKEGNDFRRNEILKEIIKNKAKNSYELTSLNFWIINNWGGIWSFKETDNNLKKIQAFSKQLTESKLTKNTFETISSLSKIASFIDSDNFFIYDSRVIYTLNWLILTSDDLEKKYFPMPESRNKKLQAFDINTIINLANIDKYRRNEIQYHDFETAYFEFCNLIKLLFGKVFNDNQANPYHLEMLLFTIADNEIFNELTAKTSLFIKL